ncbi:MAG: mannose-6-phosphate isomerase [Patescibacteria group bacterium]|nr:mannose-6-phosphate isomerase [Patescibacteria group bacterium]
MIDKLEHHFVEQRPWGQFEQFTLNQVSTVKIITVAPGQGFSLQRHTKRDEFHKVLSGKGFITLNNDRTPVEVGKVYTIPRGTIHRMEATDEPIIFLEVAMGEFDEGDIERLEDNYGRVVDHHNQNVHH